MDALEQRWPNRKSRGNVAAEDIAMKRAQIYNAPAASGSGHSWHWRALQGADASTRAFELYHDCLTDARQHGYEVELTYATGLSAPGGKRLDLDK